jgi:uncharacterized membrane protein YphA (DoxX/SURF4 family)|tara:strand:- start:109 stop:453 length:345 start_codon:yes stop_codon:yes gene_type:complete
MNLTLVLIVFSAVSFIFYGLNSFYSKRMVSEYSRWGYDKLRVFLGWCQLLGGLGLLIGLLPGFSLLTSVTSFLLTIMMLTAVFTRIKSKDKLLYTLPSVFYSIINAFIFYNTFF